MEEDRRKDNDRTYLARTDTGRGLRSLHEVPEGASVPDYRSTEGFIRLVFLRRLEGEVAHFTLITFWQNWAAIRRFAGKEVDRAKYYPEDRTFLLEFEERVTHYEVFAEA